MVKMNSPSANYLLQHLYCTMLNSIRKDYYEYPSDSIFKEKDG